MKNIFMLAMVLLIISCSSDDETIITVSTSDVNITIDENPIINQEIGTVQGITNQGSVTFSILEQTPNDALEVNATTGKITVMDETLFDFETNPIITSTIKVSNGEISDNSFVKITLNDIEEGVFHGDVTLTTQEEIDAFGANNYTVIDGNFTIDEDQNIHNIVFTDKLASITTINGVFKINNMFNWLELPGFENIISVGGIVITNNWGILDINSLSNIVNISGSITITNNGSLDSYCGIRPLLQSGTFAGTYTVSDNFFNPTQQDIIDGNCEGF